MQAGEATLTTASQPPATCPRWLEELQNATAQSTLEAELISVAHAIKEAMYLSNIMAELTFEKLI